MGVMDEIWNYEIDIEKWYKDSKSLFELEVNNTNERVLQALAGGFLNIIEDQDCLARNNYEELKLLMENNKELKENIDKKLKELTRLQTLYENYKCDQKLLNQKVKETHEAFLMARKHIKRNLNIYYSVESRDNETQVVFVQYFTENKKNGENYSVCLQRNTKTRQYMLKNTNPQLECFKELEKKLQETNDVPGVLCWIRQAFIVHKNKKL